MERDKNIVILGTGGTIAGVAEQAGTSVGYRAAQLDVAQLLQAVPDLKRVASASLQVEQLAQLDSKDMDHATWHALALRCAELLARDDVSGIVITHGTDTLEETAWFLQCVLHPAKPVVLTCAMRPATAISADGPGNLRDAVACAADMQAAGRGVLAVVAGRVFSARQVRKVHPYRVDAFDGSGAGPQGWVEEGRLRWATGGLPVVAASSTAIALPPADHWPLVELLHSHAGCNSAVALAVMQAWYGAGVRAVVVVGTGNGTLHQALGSALDWAQAQGMAVRITTRCEEGQVVQAEGARDGRVSSLPAVKARISLMLELMGWPRTDD
ncbi:asparaginase [Comamonas thiooxydans]|uniref:asparaginase n=1 Tax=Comamonas thiooxydans TaxID=363952 RepID=UPI002431BA58|nr:asparaginase [Comamonas thiooxydans]MDH1255137.1 asparaginase [Comamonas thiooxydans]